jgi:hypothetical protein
VSRDKPEIITFKVPESLKEAMQGIPNRSEFIRTAILAALDSVCPLCKGSGILLPNQKEHWDHFIQDHSLKTCNECHAIHLVCGRSDRDDTH